MPERPRPPWLKLVGGTDHTSKRALESAGEPDSESIPRVKYQELVEVWEKVVGHLPADYNTASKPERVAEAAQQVRGWGISQLHSYLSQSGIWTHPSFTKAVIEEVTERIRLKNFSPRE